MPKIYFEGRPYPCRDDETVLDALLRQGQNISFSCRSGVCHSCLMTAVQGEVPAHAQTGLSDDLVAKHYFLPCKCRPHEELHIAAPCPDDLLCAADLAEKNRLSENVWQLLLEPHRTYEYRAGQFTRIQIPGGESRSYSLASLPGHDYFLEIHVRRHAQGRVSRWLIDEAEPSTRLHISLAQGDNYYRTSDATAPLILAGSGAGLAPLLGVARDALITGHRGPVHLFHGAAGRNGLYAGKRLADLTEAYPNLHFHPCVTDEITLEQAIKNTFDNLGEACVHLAGNPATVASVRDTVRDLGVPPKRIIADPFTLGVSTSTAPNAPDDATEAYNTQPGEAPYPPADPELWNALGQGALLKTIVDEFYDAVYQDPVLSHYFQNTTKQRVQEKAYSFYRRLFSGDKVYFGDRPRNAHHWMVISDRIFDYREDLLTGFMRRHGLSDAMIARWRAIEERYRADIVKDRPRGRSVDGSVGPADGFGSIELSVGDLCNACQAEIDAGTQVRYHLRTGEVYCPACASHIHDPDSNTP